MLSKDYYISAHQDERAAIDALVAAMERLEPFGYFVGLITPEDAMGQASDLSLTQARAFIRKHRDELEEYLIRGEYARDLLTEMLRGARH